MYNRPTVQNYYQNSEVTENIISPMSNNTSEHLTPENRYCQTSNMFEYLETPNLTHTDTIGMLFPPATQLIHLVERSPQWDWEEGGTTVLLIFPQPLSSNTYYFVQFGREFVEGEFITPTVLRCKAPPKPEGIYSITVFWNQTHQITHPADFEYKKNIIAKKSKFNLHFILIFLVFFHFL